VYFLYRLYFGPIEVNGDVELIRPLNLMEWSWYHLRNSDIDVYSSDGCSLVIHVELTVYGAVHEDTTSKKDSGSGVNGSGTTTIGPVLGTVQTETFGAPIPTVIQVVDSEREPDFEMVTFARDEGEIETA
jgi:hypothetical protein